MLNKVKPNTSYKILSLHIVLLDFMIFSANLQNRTFKLAFDKMVTVVLPILVSVDVGSWFGLVLLLILNEYKNNDFFFVFLFALLLLFLLCINHLIIYTWAGRTKISVLHPKISVPRRSCFFGRTDCTR